jgi:transposase
MIYISERQKPLIFALSMSHKTCKRGIFVRTVLELHNLKIDISPRIKNEFEIQPIRWVVERTFGWMTWSRRLSKDFEIKTFYEENICIISNLQTVLKRF